MIPLSDGYWSEQHVYAVEWKSGEGGFMRWTLDGMLLFEIKASMLSTPRTVTYNGNISSAKTLYPRLLPIEPMYVILNGEHKLESI
eukprot:1531625-Prymnesium_polylepis.1